MVSSFAVVGRPGFEPGTVTRYKLAAPDLTELPAGSTERGNRTPNLLGMNQALFQLSYLGKARWVTDHAGTGWLGRTCTPCLSRIRRVL